MRRWTRAGWRSGKFHFDLWCIYEDRWCDICWTDDRIDWKRTLGRARSDYVLRPSFVAMMLDFLICYNEVPIFSTRKKIWLNFGSMATKHNTNREIIKNRLILELLELNEFWFIGFHWFCFPPSLDLMEKTNYEKQNYKNNNNIKN